MAVARPEEAAAVRRITLLLTTVLLVGLAACTPAQVEMFHSLTPEDQGRVLAELQRQQAERPLDCYTAMERVFPPSAHTWMRGVIHRESRNNPATQNRSSTAAGCAQLLRLHAHRFDAVGCSWAQRYDALCNMKAAYHLYQEAGTSPWRP